MTDRLAIENDDVGRPDGGTDKDWPEPHMRRLHTSLHHRSLGRKLRFRPISLPALSACTLQFATACFALDSTQDVLIAGACNATTTFSTIKSSGYSQPPPAFSKTQPLPL
jgi:hypothetical protein